MPSNALGWAAGALALAALLLVVRRPLLEIHPEEGPVLWREALAPGEPVVLTYVHSLLGEPVREVYDLGPDGALWVREHAYRVHGAGLGQLAGEGWVEEAPGGWTRVRGLDRRVGIFALRVGALPVDHRLQVRGRELRLSPEFAGRRLWVGGRSVPLVSWIWLRRPALAAARAPWEDLP